MSQHKSILLSSMLYSNPKITVLRSMPNGDTLALLWVFILCLCGRTSRDGRLVICGQYPHTPLTISGLLHFDVDTVKTALQLYLDLNMLRAEVDVSATHVLHRGMGRLSRRSGCQTAMRGS